MLLTAREIEAADTFMSHPNTHAYRRQATFASPDCWPAIITEAMHQIGTATRLARAIGRGEELDSILAGTALRLSAGTAPQPVAQKLTVEDMAQALLKVPAKNRDLPRAAILALFLHQGWVKPSVLGETVKEARDLLVESLRTDLQVKSPGLSDEQRETLLSAEVRYYTDDALSRIYGALTTHCEDGFAESRASGTSTAKTPRREYRALPAGISLGLAYMLAQPQRTADAGASPPPPEVTLATA